MVSNHGQAFEGPRCHPSHGFHNLSRPLSATQICTDILTATEQNQMEYFKLCEAHRKATKDRSYFMLNKVLRVTRKSNASRSQPHPSSEIPISKYQIDCISLFSLSPCNWNSS